MFVNSFIKRHWRILIVEAILIVITLVSVSVIALNLEAKKLYIAIVFDKSTSRQTVKNALEVYKKRINKYGGIKIKDADGGSEEKQLEFVYCQDFGSSEQAKEIAHGIIQKKKNKLCDDNYNSIVKYHNIAAVIGHFNEETTTAAAPIYDSAKKPLFVPWSQIKSKSKWIFQLSPTSGDYGSYAAHYIWQVLDKKVVTIIHSDNKNNLDIVESFTSAFTRLGGKIERNVSVEDHKEKFFDKQAMSGIKNNGNNMLLLATEHNQAVSLIVALKNNGIDIPIMSMDNNLGNSFNDFEEQGNKYPGYFSKGIYTPSLLLFDNMRKDMALVGKDYDLNKKTDENYKNNKLTLAAMKVVLAASFIKNGLEEERPKKESDKITREENKIISYAQRSDWFNSYSQNHVRATKLVIGVYDHRNLVKAPVNPITVNEGDLSDEDNNKLLKIDDRLLYPADVVYSGVSMNKISNLDIEHLEYDLDFFVWFRYRYGVEDAYDIEFLNSLKEARLLDLVNETKRRQDEKIETPEGAMTASLVSETSFPKKEPHRWSYRCYRVTGRFKTNDAKNYALGHQNLYVMFRNYRLNKFKLNYVADYLYDNRGIYSIEEVKKSNTEELNHNLIDKPLFEIKYAYTYIDKSKKTMLGRPEGIYASNDFTKFISEYRVEPILMSFRGIVYKLNGILSRKTGKSEDEINVSVIVLFFSFSIALWLLSIYGDHTSASNKYSTWWMLLKLSLFLFMLLFGHLVISQLLYSVKKSPWGISHQSTITVIMYYWEKVVGIASFLIPAYYIASAFDQFLWHRIEKRTGVESTAILRLFVRVIIYTLAGLGIMYSIFDVKSSNSLVATTGAVAVLFAVASKIDLSNVLAGLGISFAKLFKLHDWVKIDGIEGKVIEMTSRSTKILTFESSIINIPNSKVAGAVVENFNRPDLPYRLIIHMELVPEYRFERVEKLLLDAVKSTDGVTDHPKPFVIFKGQGDSCQIYEVAFYITDYAKKAILWQAAWRRIWRHLEQAGIQMATPQREVFLPKKLAENLNSPLTVVNNCGAFTELTDEEKAQLADNAERRSYRAGEVIVSHEERQDRIFILTEGVVSLIGLDGQEKRLGVADVFGLDDQSACATLTAITDSELLTVKKEKLPAFTERKA